MVNVELGVDKLVVREQQVHVNVQSNLVYRDVFVNEENYVLKAYEALKKIES